ncbi:F-box protein PP2-B1 [Trifolium pratense]|uniref:F-box protein PP2-B1 n=1 Tax=Trifolium pratense TaxID=57577 RepID=A0A2K3L628_TRIPR|nr:F-box protein PP2-B1 [Trifolium pratense]
MYQKNISMLFTHLSLASKFNLKHQDPSAVILQFIFTSPAVSFIWLLLTFISEACGARQDSRWCLWKTMKTGDVHGHLVYDAHYIQVLHAYAEADSVTCVDTEHRPADALHLTNTMFPEVAKLRSVCWFHIHGMINMFALSPNTQYAAYLVFKMIDAYGFQNQDYPVELLIGVEGGHSSIKFVYLDPDVGRRLGRRGREHNRVVELPRPIVRSDGWLEIEIGEFFSSGLEDEKVEMNIEEKSDYNSNGGLFLEGIEVRPK